MPSVTTYSPTGDPYIDGVLTGVKWGVNSLTFSFPSDSTFYGSNYGSGEPTNGFLAFTATQQTAVRTILQMDSAVANVTFTEVTETSTNHGDLRYAESNSPSTAWAYYPSTSETGGDSWYNNSSHWYDNPAKGNYAWLTMLHESGHAMGLKHPQDVKGSFGAMPLDHDSLEYTVMSYRSYVGAGLGGYTNGAYSYPQTLMMYDIAALQTLYGANYTTNGGNTVYTWNSSTGQESVNGVGQGAPGGNKIFMTLWDGGGHDSYDFSNYTTNLKVDLQPGHWTTVSTIQLANLDSTHNAAGNIANALLYNNNAASLIEDAIGGSGNDSIIGNTADNALTGGRGDDLLDGSIGSDTAVYLGSSASYAWVKNADGSFIVTDLGSGFSEGVDTLKNVEYLMFSDTIVALPVNHAPVAVDDTASTLQDTAADINVLANDSDPDSDPLVISGTPTALHGSVSVNPDGTLHYAPTAGYYGADTITYVVSDGSLTDTGLVAMTVSTVTGFAVNHAPVAVDDTASTLEDTAVDINVLANDSDPDSNPLFVFGTPTAQHGSVTVNADGTLHYTPTANYNGSDTISYTVTDGLLTDIGQVAVTVAAVNDAPVAANDVFSTAMNKKLIISVNTGVLGNDYDVDGNAIKDVLVSNPAHGSLKINSNGGFTYTPDKNYVGTDSFTYKDSDGSTTSNIATVTIKVGTAAGQTAGAATAGADTSDHSSWWDVNDQFTWSNHWHNENPHNAGLADVMHDQIPAPSQEQHQHTHHTDFLLI